jgi:hypothetical protein
LDVRPATKEPRQSPGTTMRPETAVASTVADIAALLNITRWMIGESSTIQARTRHAPAAAMR